MWDDDLGELKEISLFSTVLKDKVVKTRKNGHCSLCNKEYKRGTLMHRVCYIDTYGTFLHGVYCERCYPYVEIDLDKE